MAKRGRSASLELIDTMGVLQIADALDRLIFTAAHQGVRTVKIDRNTRDLIVRAIRADYDAKNGPDR